MQRIYISKGRSEAEMKAGEQEGNNKEEKNEQKAVEKEQPEAVEFSHLDKATADLLTLKRYL